MLLTLESQFTAEAASLLPWLDDPQVSDVLVNGCASVFVDRGQGLEAIANPFADSLALGRFLERLLIPLGRRVDAQRPFVDGQLADGSRFHLILPPLAQPGPVLSIRKVRRLRGEGLDVFGGANTVGWLEQAFLGGMSVLLTGGTGAGKTTFLGRLLETLPAHERLVLIEETRELAPKHPHVVRLQARPPSPDGVGEVSLRTLIRQALRMRPSRLVLGECRGEEAWDLLQAMNTGHLGSACTLHANSALDGLRRLETLVLMAGVQAPLHAVREWVAGAVQIVVHLEQRGGARRLAEILRVTGMEGERYRVLPMAVK